MTPTRGQQPTEGKLLPMPAQNAANWIRVGLFALPLSGALIAWSSLDPQPDQAEQPEAWARFVGSAYYLLTHVGGSMGSALWRSRMVRFTKAAGSGQRLLRRFFYALVVEYITCLGDHALLDSEASRLFRFRIQLPMFGLLGNSEHEKGRGCWTPALA
jgi:hypothetical protein